MIPGREIWKFFMQGKHSWNCNKISFAGEASQFFFVHCVELMSILLGPTDLQFPNASNAHISRYMCAQILVCMLLKCLGHSKNCWKERHPIDHVALPRSKSMVYAVAALWCLDKSLVKFFKISFQFHKRKFNPLAYIKHNPLAGTRIWLSNLFLLLT